ncbi:hypothetical protein OA067_06945 [Gammaproteobacteria bacterium]|nr:hypothetical protein [Gammaproteobacteria bacterium]
MKFESHLKGCSLAALFLFASIPVIAASQPPSQTLEEIKQSLIYQGMNEKGYFRSVGFIKSGRVESESTIYVSKFSPENFREIKPAITKFSPSECRAALNILDGVPDSRESSYRARPTPKIGFNHVSVLPDSAPVEIQNIASALARIYRESAEALPNIAISAKMSPRSAYEGYFLNTSTLHNDTNQFQIISMVTLSEKGIGKSRAPFVRLWDMPSYIRGSVEVLAKITLLKDQQLVETWKWSFSIPSGSMPWTVPAMVSKLESVIGSKIVDNLIDVNSVVRCSPEIELQAKAIRDKYVLNAGSSSGLSVGDLFVLIPSGETFRNRGLLAGAELSMLVEVAKLNRTEAELLVIDGKESLINGITFLAKSVETI